MSGHEDLLRRAYSAFNGRDIDAALSLMHPDVDWPNGMEGGRVQGHDAVRAYWERQFELIDSRVEPQAFEDQPDGRVRVAVKQHVRSLDGNVLSDGLVTHTYEIRNGLIAAMQIDQRKLAAASFRDRRTSTKRQSGG